MFDRGAARVAREISPCQAGGRPLADAQPATTCSRATPTRAALTLVTNTRELVVDAVLATSRAALERILRIARLRAPSSRTSRGSGRC